MTKDDERHAAIDRVNRAAMAAAGTVAHYEAAHALDESEALLFEHVRSIAAGQPILDLGVGGGRTVAALTALSADYRAIDYTEAMVEACRKRFPRADVQHGDARDLRRFADGTFALVVFSCAGIDMVGRSDRLRILDEVSRVLRPGGAFVFSTHNRGHGPDAPTVRDLFPPVAWGSHPLVLGRSLLRSLVVGARQVRNHRKNRRHDVRTAHYAIRSSHYHEYTTMMHFTTRDAQEQELREHGFRGEVTCLTHEGTEAPRASSSTLMFHLCAMK